MRRNIALPSRPFGFQPFTPNAWSAIWIRASITIKSTDEFRALCRVRSLPIFGFIRLKHVVAVTQDFLTVNDVLQRRAAGVSQHIVQHHEGGRSSQASFAMKMGPGIFWKRADRENESVHFIIERSRVIGDGDADIARASGLNNIALNVRTLDSHLLRWDGIGVAVFHRMTRPNINFAPTLKRCHSRSFIGFNFALTSTDV